MWEPELPSVKRNGRRAAKGEARGRVRARRDGTRAPSLNCLQPTTHAVKHLFSGPRRPLGKYSEWDKGGANRPPRTRNPKIGLNLTGRLAQSLTPGGVSC